MAQSLSRTPQFFSQSLTAPFYGTLMFFFVNKLVQVRIEDAEHSHV